MAGVRSSKTAVEKSPVPSSQLAAELLGKIDAPVTRADDLKVLRAVEVLRTWAHRKPVRDWRNGLPATGHRMTTKPPPPSPARRPAVENNSLYAEGIVFNSPGQRVTGVT